MNDKIQFIRQKCIEANPEIVELKFGCLLRNKASGYISGIYLGYDSTTNNSLVSKLDGGYMWQFKALGNMRIGDWTPTEMGKHGLSDWSIVGRPIHFADVALAIEEAHELSGNRAGELISTWNLRKDSLEDQSPDTIQFLYELLK